MISHFDYDYYNLYLYNIHTLINEYGYKYYWFDITKEKFLNGTGQPEDKFSNTHDKFLLKYQNEKKELGKSILKDGTYTPFFFFKNEKGEKVLMLGKHRLYALQLCAQDMQIDREFLFIEFPHNPLDNNIIHIESIKPTLPLYLFDIPNNIIEPELIYPTKEWDINFTCLCTGDFLSDYFYTEKIVPSNIINSKQKFENFLNNKEVIK